MKSIFDHLDYILGVHRNRRRLGVKRKRDTLREIYLHRGKEVGLSYNVLWLATLNWGKGTGRKRCDE